MTIKIHQKYHDIHIEILRWLSRVMIVFVEQIKRKAQMRGILLTSFLSRKDVREMQVSRQRFHQLERKMNNACTCALHMENTISCSCQWKRWREMREWGGFPSLPSFKGRRWGKFIFLFIVHTNTIIRQPNEFRISSRMQWYILFVSVIMLKGAAQRNICTLLFFRIWIFIVISDKLVFTREEQIFLNKKEAVFSVLWCAHNVSNGSFNWWTNLCSCFCE